MYGNMVNLGLGVLMQRDLGLNLAIAVCEFLFIFAASFG
jgi:hypothetical protein